MHTCILYTIIFNGNYLNLNVIQVDENMIELKNQLQQAELDFVRKLGQLKYLNHLKKNQIVEDCPICNVQPETKVCS